VIVETMTEKQEATPKSTVGAVTKKAAYAVVGAPVVATKRLGRLSGKWRRGARREFEKWATEGERLTAELRQGKVVEEIKDKVDFDHLQGRVEKLRDQLEDVLANWRANFKPEKPEATEAEEKIETVKKTVKKATATAKAATTDKVDR
jgi:ElaB/YqjD/DUF883 family membrane-anchored ribosome-binding protein